MRTWLPRSICTTGGSISRPRQDVFREAADLAYYFHWPRSEIMTMTGKERNIWLSQIMRIHHEQHSQRQLETREASEMIESLRKEYEMG